MAGERVVTIRHVSRCISKAIANQASLRVPPLSSLAAVLACCLFEAESRWQIPSPMRGECPISGSRLHPFSAAQTFWASRDRPLLSFRRPRTIVEHHPRHSFRVRMQRNTGLRDPFAEDDDAPPRAAAGRPPPRFPKSEQAPLRNVAGTSSSPYAGSLGAPRLAPPRSAPRNDTASASTSASTASRPLGLSLGLPRSRMPPKRETNTTEGDSPKTAADIARQADDAVRNTDSDALLSRLSALKLGYLPPEPFTQEFSSSSATNSAGPMTGSSFPRPHQQGVDARRSPLINIGTYLRCTAIDAEVEAFLTQGNGPKQIISIGAGSDSRYWRLMVSPPTHLDPSFIGELY